MLLHFLVHLEPVFPMWVGACLQTDSEESNPLSNTKVK